MNKINLICFYSGYLIKHVTIQILLCVYVDVFECLHMMHLKISSCEDEKQILSLILAALAVTVYEAEKTKITRGETQPQFQAGLFF